AFSSLFSVAAIAEVVRQKFVRSRRSLLVYCGSLFLLTGLGVFDQTSTSFALPYVREGEYAQNQQFIAQIESTLAEGAKVFQLPYLAYPESLGIHGVTDYEPLRGYLHSKKLCWSYPAMRGSESDLWQQQVAALPPEKMVTTLALAGFEGIYVDRFG